MSEPHEDVFSAAKKHPERAVFVSRAGAQQVQKDLAIWIAQVLLDNGYIPILEDWHFKNTNFMMAMDHGLRSAARVMALHSREYQESEHCLLECSTVLTDDPGNTKRRLIVLRVDETMPAGVLKGIAFIDFLTVWQTGNAEAMRDAVLDSLETSPVPGPQRPPVAIDPMQRVHHEVLAHDEKTFTGRDVELQRLRDTLWQNQSATLTRQGAIGVDEATLAGMAGVGKTTLARAYAYRNRGEYQGVWWIRAETEETILDDLIQFGAHELPHLNRMEDRAAAAREALQLVSERPTAKPWLFVYDNALGPGQINPWRPHSNAHILMTSRNPHWDEAVPLDVFTEEAAVDFLCQTANRHTPQDRIQAAALAGQLGYLPLSLAHAGSKCRSNPFLNFAAYGARLAEYLMERPDATSQHGKYPNSVFATFTLAMEDIVAGSEGHAPCPEAEIVMGALALLAPEQIPGFMLEPLYRGNHAVMFEAEFHRALEALVQAALVVPGAFEGGEPHLSVHRMVRTVMTSRASAAQRTQEFSELAIKAVESSHDGSESFRSAVRNLQWLPHAIAALDTAPLVGAVSWHTIWTQFAIGNLEVQRGSLDRAIKVYRAAAAICERLAQSAPENAAWQRDLSVSYVLIGDVQSAQGNLGAALASYQRILEVASRLAQSDPENAQWQRDLSLSCEKIGDVQMAQGNLGAALAYYQRALETRERLTQSAPENASWQREFLVTYDKIGDVQMAKGNLEAGLASYQLSLEARESLTGNDPENAGLQRDLAASYNRVGDVQRAQGNLEAAIASYQRFLEVAERLARNYSENAQIQRDLSTGYNRIGDVEKDQGNLGLALAFYQRALEARERLAQSDPGNANWQRDVSVSYERIGSVHMAQGNLGAALASYQRFMEIAERLAQSDPENAGLQRDLSTICTKIGDVQLAQGNLGAASISYLRALEVVERLARSDPENAIWQRDLWTADWRMADMAEKSGSPDASAWWRKCYGQILAMKQRGILAPPDEGFLTTAKAKAE